METKRSAAACRPVLSILKQSVVDTMITNGMITDAMILV